jgi:hypothetical protein
LSPATFDGIDDCALETTGFLVVSGLRRATQYYQRRMWNELRSLLAKGNGAGLEALYERCRQPRRGKLVVDFPIGELFGDIVA